MADDTGEPDPRRKDRPARTTAGGKPGKTSDRDDRVNWGQYLGVGLQIAVGAGLGLLVGRWLDNKYQWSPWGTVICVMLGVAAGMYLLIKDAIRMNKD